MSKRTKIWLIIAVCLVLSGAVIFLGVMSVLNFDFLKLSTFKYETNNYKISEEYKNISIVTDTADIEFIPSDDSKTTVICYEQDKVKHSVSVNGETLEIKSVDTRKWYDHIGISFGSQKIKVCIPEGDYGLLSVKGSTGDVNLAKEFSFEDVDVNISTGDIYAQGITTDNMKLRVSTGKITVKDINCKYDLSVKVSTGKSDIANVNCNNFTSSGNTGDTTLNSVVVKEKLSIKRSTGDVKFESCDAGEIFIETDTGDVTGSLLTDKVFIVSTDTGKTDVPKTTTGGRCEITTDTGDINVKIKK